MDSFYHAIQTICVYAIPLIFAITLHESAHGWAAGRLGDPTATMLGRVTINPIPHIDPIGTIAVPGALLLMSALKLKPAAPYRLVRLGCHAARRLRLGKARAD